MPEFIHLHLHTEYSLLDGACRVDELLEQAARQKVPAMAVTEHGNMFSSVVFHDKARQKGVKPILGCETYVATGSRFTKGGGIGETYNHLVLLAETREGYQNLIRLVSAGYTEGFHYRPRIDRELLAKHSAGLIGLSSCLKGEIPARLLAEQERQAIEAAAFYRDTLGAGNFFLEMQYQGIEEQKVVNTGLQRVAKALDLPLVCTNDVHYLHREDFKAHDILLCIGKAKTVNDAQRMRYYGDQFYLKTPEEMAAVFGDYPDAMANTVRIAERCSVDLGKTVHQLPNFDVPAPFGLEEYFEKMVWEGFDSRLPRLRSMEAAGLLRHTIDEYRERVAYEIAMIKRMGYAGYFLIVWDFIRYSREQGIPVGPGRGSAAGSVVAYCLKITDVDPLHFDLIFERFLNPERVSLPDIDIDFCERRRGEVIEYVDAEVRPRERCADHHLRDDEGEGRRAGRGPRARHRVCRGGQGRQADPADARHDARQGAGREPGAQGPGDERPAGEGTAGGCAAARGDDAPRLGPRRRRRDRPEADHRVRAAAQGGAGRNHDPVEHEGDRADRSPEDGLPGAQHAHPAGRRRPRDQADDGARCWTWRRCRSTTRRRTTCSRTARRSACSSSRVPGCATSCGRPSPSGSRT